jgi:hypothetical protein
MWLSRRSCAHDQNQLTGMKVYVTDSGHYMEEDDFMQFLIDMTNTTMKALSKEEFIKTIWDDDYFGDNIIDKELFMAMKIRFKNLL